MWSGFATSKATAATSAGTFKRSFVGFFLRQAFLQGSDNVALR
jgi:hypothetical protein